MTNENTYDSLYFRALQTAANAEFGEPIDWDMRGTPITRTDALMAGAYGPAVRRLIALAVEQWGIEKPSSITLERLRTIAPEAFAQAVDKNFAGQVMSDYGIVLSAPHGFAPTTLKLVQLAVARRKALLASIS